MRRSVKIAIATLAVGSIGLVGGALGYMYHNYSQEHEKVRDLEFKLNQLQEDEKRATVMQSINAQMEEIANQERIISEEQREEALQQSKIANEMRLNAEKEQRNARIAEQKAIEASKVADRERVIAEKQRSQAEYSKRVADTLTYLAMARTLASAAITQETTGNKQLAALLSYASYLFTKRYQGDVYHSTIYQSLLQTSGGQRRWAVAHGSIMKMTLVPGTKDFMTVSTYGEILRHSMQSGNLQSKTIYSNSSLDFRDIYINDNRVLYAISHSGHLVVSKENNRIHVVPIDGAIRPFRIFSFSENILIVTAEQSVHVIDAVTLRPIKTLFLDFKTAIAGKKNGQIVLFDLAGNMYVVNKDITKTTKQHLPFKGRVMSYNYDNNTRQQAFGMYDGTVYFMEGNGKLHKLVGHNSRVSRIIFVQNRLYTSSYDGSVKFWNINSEKMDPIDVLSLRQWIISLSFDTSKKNIWTGDQNGNLTETMIDVTDMANKVKARLKRNLTRDEWNYYIGKNIPYETFVGKEEKP